MSYIVFVKKNLLERIFIIRKDSFGDRNLKKKLFYFEFSHFNCQSKYKLLVVLRITSIFELFPDLLQFCRISKLSQLKKNILFKECEMEMTKMIFDHISKCTLFDTIILINNFLLN